MIKINYWKSAKVPTVQYGSQDVSLRLETECEKEKLNEVYEELKNEVNRRVEEEANRIAFESKKDVSHLRIREKNGKKYPSVTTILNPEPYTNDPAYGVRGTEYHRLFNHWVKTGEVLNPDLTLNIKPLNWDLDFSGFIKEFKEQIDRKSELNVPVFNEEWMYSGEIDAISKLSLDDFKTGGYKLEQIVAYNECLEKPRPFVRFLDLKNKKVVSVPYGHKDYNKAKLNFIYKRGIFKERFGI